MNLSAYAPLVALMYTDKMEIYRRVPTSNEDGTTSTKLPDTPTHSGVACRISFASDENSNSSEIDETPIVISPKVFCALSVDVQAGDFLKVTRFDTFGNMLGIFNGVAGLPTPYDFGQQFNFTMKGSA